MLKCKQFYNRNVENKFNKFIENKNIKREQIVSFTEDKEYTTMWYYCE